MGTYTCVSKFAVWEHAECKRDRWLFATVALSVGYTTCMILALYHHFGWLIVGSAFGAAIWYTYQQDRRMKLVLFRMIRNPRSW